MSCLETTVPKSRRPRWTEGPVQPEAVQDHHRTLAEAVRQVQGTVQPTVQGRIEYPQYISVQGGVQCTLPPVHLGTEWCTMYITPGTDRYRMVYNVHYPRYISVQSGVQCTLPPVQIGTVWCTMYITPGTDRYSVVYNVHYPRYRCVVHYPGSNSVLALVAIPPLRAAERSHSSTSNLEHRGLVRQSSTRTTEQYRCVRVSLN